MKKQIFLLLPVLACLLLLVSCGGGVSDLKAADLDKDARDGAVAVPLGSRMTRQLGADGGNVVMNVTAKADEKLTLNLTVNTAAKHYTDQKTRVSYPGTEANPTPAPQAGAYTLAVVDNDGKTVLEKSGTAINSSFTFDGRAGMRYTAAVTTHQEGEIIMSINGKKDPKETLPFPTALMGTAKLALPAADPNTDPCEPCPVKYVKSPTGTYIFANNPEMLQPEDIDICNMRNENLSGKIEFTFEHSNHSKQPIYAGYRLVNNGAKDMVVTVYNIGYQYVGEWLGHRSWSDFYNLEFHRPADYLDKNGDENWYYVGQDFLQHTPTTYQPQTFVVPAGQYLWVLGGTTADNCGNANVGNTADISVPNGRCMNGVVLFDITQGEKITGSLYFYTDAAKCDESKPQQGYITWRDGTKYAAQYKGTDPTMGLIEANFNWTVNDKTPDGRLPVTYTNRYDSRAQQKHEPYEAYNSTEHQHRSNSWLIALNPQNAHNAVGEDMTVFNCVTPDGKAVLLDNDHADGAGEPGNFGNWMITYQDNYTFANTGDKPRTFKIYVTGGATSTIIAAVRDRDGNVLSSELKCNPILPNTPPTGEHAGDYVKRGNTWFPITDSGEPYYKVVDEFGMQREVTVQPHTTEQITVEYLILGNSNGGLNHWVTLGS